MGVAALTIGLLCAASFFGVALRKYMQQRQEIQSAVSFRNAIYHLNKSQEIQHLVDTHVQGYDDTMALELFDRRYPKENRQERLAAIQAYEEMFAERASTAHQVAEAQLMEALEQKREQTAAERRAQEAKIERRRQQIQRQIERKAWLDGYQEPPRSRDTSRQWKESLLEEEALLKEKALLAREEADRKMEEADREMQKSWRQLNETQQHVSGVSKNTCCTGT